MKNNEISECLKDLHILVETIQFRLNYLEENFYAIHQKELDEIKKFGEEFESLKKTSKKKKCE